MNALSTTFYELFADNLAVRPGKTALVDPARSVTYAEAAAEIDRVAAYLREQGIKSGERVIVHLNKSIAEVVAMLAAAKLGAVVVNVNAQLTPDQLDYVANDCGARLMIVGARAANALAGRPLPPSIARVLVSGPAPERAAFDPWPDGDVTDKTQAHPLDSELAMIIYTSGSTGKPKGVMLSHRNILAGARSVARYLKLSEADRLLSVLPYSFDYGLNQLTTMMLMGGTIVHQPVAMAAEIVQSLVRHEITGLAAVPPLWSQIVRVLDVRPTSLPSLRRITNSGGKISPEILKRLPYVFPDTEIYLMYGLTEAFRSTYLRPEKFHAKMGSMGQAIPGVEVYVVKAGEGIAGPGEHGELVHRGPLVSLGYWGLPEVTAAKIRPCPELAHRIGDEPVVYSGDIVYADADGDLWFVGRNDAMIKTSGFRLSPEEVEDVVYRSGMVAEAVAFGVDDEELGQVVNVAVVLLDGFEEAQLLQHCRLAMPSYMVPRAIHVWPQVMPRTSSGKLARPEVVRACKEASGSKLVNT
jgi:acyl-CoA ligase (AMP-forming) (exosortase A-associated)